jgi:uncharacterized membrane protein YdjX (TVP38/TMEM64 family)
MTASDARRPEISNRVHRLIGRAIPWAVLPYLLLAGVAVVAVVVLGRDVEHHITALESWVAAQGPRGWIVFVAVFVVTTSVLLPESIVSIAAGALFGPLEGLGVVVGASLVASALQYGLARRFFRAKIERWLVARPSLAAIQRAVLGDELRLQTLLRLTPLNPASLNYSMGAAGVRFPGFLLASLATTPHLLLEVWFGYAGKHVARIAGRSARAIIVHDVVVVGGLAACLIAVLIVSRVARRAVEEAVAVADPMEGTDAPG